MLEKLLIIGAKGFAKELLEAVVQTGRFEEIRFYDDLSENLPDRLFDKFEIVRSFDEAIRFLRAEGSTFALGIGHPDHREMLFERFTAAGAAPATVISPFAKIGGYGNQIGEGVTILTDAVVETSNVIGKGSLIHVGAIISHDTVIGEFCEISPRASILGGVTLGARCRVGTGAIILPRVRLAERAIVGAGAVVTRNVEPEITVVGVPARPVNS